MIRTLTGVSFIAAVFMVAPLAAFCQAGADKASFDIADVHVSPRADWVKTQTHSMQGGYLSGDRYELRRATMLDMIKTAYNVDADKIYGGPSWLDYDRFEVVAKTKPGTSPETLRVMLQTLLAERFGLNVKPGTQPVAGYTLSKGKGELKLKPGGTIGDIGCRSGTSFSIGVGGERSAGNAASNATTSACSRLRSRWADLSPAPLAIFPWWIPLALKARGTSISNMREPPRTLPALRDRNIRLLAGELGKLGLLLELGRVPQPVLTVEKASEQPSPNATGVDGLRCQRVLEAGVRRRDGAACR